MPMAREMAHKPTYKYMYVCIFICVHVYVYLSLSSLSLPICMYMYAIRICVCKSICKGMCKCLCICTCMHICLYMYACNNIHIYVRVWVCICEYMYTHREMHCSWQDVVQHDTSVLQSTPNMNVQVLPSYNRSNGGYCSFCRSRGPRNIILSSSKQSSSADALNHEYLYLG